MSRPIEFSPEIARVRIAEVFSANGYNGTSLSMLMHASGLGKQSLYNAFGDKKKMYMDAVDCAVSTFGAVIPKMNRASSGMAALKVFFDYLIACCVSQSPSTFNCIVSNGLLNNAEDAQMQVHHAERWAMSRAALMAAIERGVIDGSIGRHFSPANGADLLISLVSGLRVSARAIINSSASEQGSERIIKLARMRLGKSVALALTLFKPGADQ